MFRYILFSSLFFNYLFSQTIFSFENEDMNIKVEKVFSNLGVPWGMTYISNNEILITQKSGKIKILNIDTKEKRDIVNSPSVANGGQGGLLDVQKSPNFKKDSTLYFTYVKSIEKTTVTTLAKAKLSNYNLVEWEDLLVSKSKSNTSRHFGSRITFDEKGHIFFSIGDRGVRKNAQDLTNHAGTIIRLNLDGSIPHDNPFINDKNKLPEIYSYGHRNPQGLFYDVSTNNLWSIEHGPRGGDEINIIKKGFNYGWPVISYGKEYLLPLKCRRGNS